MHKVFNDSVHGHISIPETCVKLIDTLEFQRLRNIKQLGICCFVYPAACHTRFEHSLGTCYLAGKMAEALNTNSTTKIRNEEIECLQIAGLCHDIGHGPFSHMWENIVGGGFRHEDMSIVIFERMMKNSKIWSDIPDKEDRIQMVKDMMAGITTDDLVRQGKKKWYLYQIVANKQNGIDVDKWDYFLRDGHQLNLGVTFDYRRILENCKIVKVKVEGMKPGEVLEVEQVCFRDKEAFNIYEMFTNRATLHHKAYQHPVVKCIETMLLDAVVEYDRRNDRHDSWVNISKEASKAIDDKVQKYLQLTDHILNEVQCDPGSAVEIKQAKELIHRIFKRKLYKRFSKRLSLEPGQMFKNRDVIKGELIKHLKIKQGAPDLLKEEHFEVKVIDINLSSEKGVPFNDIIFYDKNGELKKKELNDVMIFASVQPSTRHTVVQVLYKGVHMEDQTKIQVEEFMRHFIFEEDQPLEMDR